MHGHFREKNVFHHRATIQTFKGNTLFKKYYKCNWYAFSILLTL